MHTPPIKSNEASKARWKERKQESFFREKKARMNEEEESDQIGKEHIHMKVIWNLSHLPKQQKKLIYHFHD